MIYIKNICKTFIDDNKKEVHAVNDVSLTINDGDIFGIIGFSGAGKGTIMKKLVSETDDFALSSSMTTRPPREGEQHGK